MIANDVKEFEHIEQNKKEKMERVMKEHKQRLEEQMQQTKERESLTMGPTEYLLNRKLIEDGDSTRKPF